MFCFGKPKQLSRQDLMGIILAQAQAQVQAGAVMAPLILHRVFVVETEEGLNDAFLRDNPVYRVGGRLTPKWRRTIFTRSAR